MSFEEQFDKIVRQKAEEQAYPFDEANWEKASQMIDASRKGAAVPAGSSLWIPAVIGVVVAGAGIVAASYFIGTNNTNHKALLETGKENTLVTPSSAHEKNSTDASASPVNTETGTSPVVISNTELTKTEKEGSTSADAAAALRPDRSSIQPANPSIRSTSPNTSLAEQQSNQQTNGHRSVNSSGVQQESTATSGSQPENVLSSQTPNHSAASSNNSSMNADLNAWSANQSQARQEEGTAVQESAVPAVPSNLNPESKSEPGTNGSEMQVAASEALFTEFLPMRYSVNDTNGNESLSSSFQFLSCYETDYYKSLPKYYTNYFGLQAGAAYLLGWQTNNITDAKGMNWYAGIQAGHYFNRYIGFGAGVEVFSIEHIQQPFYKNTMVQYSFGSSTSYTLVTSNQLYYVALPIKAHLRFNKAHVLSLGFTAGWLSQAKNTEATYLSSDFNSPAAPAKQVYGVYQGANRLNMMLSADYQLKVTNKLTMTGGFNYGLSDLFKNNSFISAIEKPIGIRLGLQFNLFQK